MLNRQVMLMMITFIYPERDNKGDNERETARQIGQEHATTERTEITSETHRDTERDLCGSSGQSDWMRANNVEISKV